MEYQGEEISPQEWDAADREYLDEMLNDGDEDESNGDKQQKKETSCNELKKAARWIVKAAEATNQTECNDAKVARAYLAQCERDEKVYDEIEAIAREYSHSVGDAIADRVYAMKCAAIKAIEEGV